jgi:hypothetical protein
MLKRTLTFQIRFLCLLQLRMFKGNVQLRQASVLTIDRWKNTWGSENI